MEQPYGFKSDIWSMGESSQYNNDDKLPSMHLVLMNLRSVGGKYAHGRQLNVSVTI